MGCGCGKKGNRAKSVSSTKNKSRRSTGKILKEMWDKSKTEKKKTKVTRINNKT
jgi:hypothetical protein